MGSDKDGDVSIALVRRIDASTSDVYIAWTEPEVIAEWFAVGEDVVTSVSTDVKCGGKYSIKGRHDDGGAYAITGTYIDLVPNRRIVMTWNYDGPVEALRSNSSVVIAEIREINSSVTELTLTHERQNSEAVADLLREAWDSCIDKLEHAAGKKRPTEARRIEQDEVRRKQTMPTHQFDDKSITWYALDWLPNLEFYVYKVDTENKIIDILFKFAKNAKVQLHQHKAPYITFVIQGELRFYRPNGELKEIRPAGSYVSGVANGEPHLEGGGDEDAIVFFSNRNVEGPLYEFLDDNMQPTITLGIKDFQEQLEKQGNPKWRPAAA